MPADEQIVKHHVDQIRGQVRHHGDLGVARTALRCVDGHRKSVKQRADHDDLEIRHRHVQHIFACAGKNHHRSSKEIPKHTEDNGNHSTEQHRKAKTAIGIQSLHRTLSPSNNRRDRNVERHDGSQHDHLRLIGQANSGDGSGTERRNHDGVDHADQPHQHRFQRGRPGDAERRLVDFFTGRQFPADQFLSNHLAGNEKVAYSICEFHKKGSSPICVSGETFSLCFHYNESVKKMQTQ